MKARNPKRGPARRAAEVYVGTSGWYYDHWEGVLYPPGLPKAKRFAVYAQRYNAVEINATYYRIPPATTVEGWRARALIELSKKNGMVGARLAVPAISFP